MILGTPELIFTISNWGIATLAYFLIASFKLTAIAFAALALVLASSSGFATRALQAQDAISASSTTAAPAAILITDCGSEMDDQWALAHLLLSTELDLRAVITTHASIVKFSSAQGAEVAADVIRHVLPERASHISRASRTTRNVLGFASGGERTCLFDRLGWRFDCTESRCGSTSRCR